MGAHNIQNPLIHRFSTCTRPENLPARPPPNTATFLPSIVSSDSPRPQFEFKAGAESSLSAPKPLESLHETRIPPFLSKTYDLVNDPSLDSIISWGEKGNSFVVWEPVQLARMILPRNFKHNNFSTFVRQLNTYGFRKTDTEKWEFTNEGFVRGQRHLLKNIPRRKSHHLGGPSNEAVEAAFEGEIEEMRKERSLMMQEVIELQHEQRGTIQHMEVMKEKLEATERRQKQLISFLARKLREQNNLASPRTIRRFVEHQPHELGQIVNQPPGHDELVMVNELLHAPEKSSVPTSETTPPLLRHDGVMNPPPRSANEYFISSPQNLVMENGFPEFLIAGDESTVDVMCTSTTDPWGYLTLSNYGATDLGGFSDVGSMELGGSSGINMWLDEESPVN